MVESIAFRKISELIRIKTEVADAYKCLDSKQYSTDINQLSFKIKNYKKWLLVLSDPEVSSQLAELSSGSGAVEQSLNSINGLNSGSLKNKLLEILTTGEIAEIAESRQLLKSLQTGEIAGIPPTLANSAPSATPLLSTASATPLLSAASSVKKRLANVELSVGDTNAKILYDLQRITGVGASNAEKLAKVGATLDGILSEWTSLIAQNSENSVIMLEKLVPAPPRASQAEMLSIARQRKKLLDAKFAPTKFIKLLNHHQLVGVKYFNQIEKRIPRTEIMEIEEFLKEIAKRMSPDFIITICGSYRRGKETSGDVDVFLTHRQFKEKSDLAKFKCSNILSEFVLIATATGFITDHLTDDGETKYMGMCRLKGHEIAHRIDIRLICYNSYAPAILYFTGSFTFNQQMRNHALTKGYTLNEYGLYKCRRDPETRKIVKGELVFAETEEDIFKIINYPYKTPQERDI
jgi:DNA polymerase beta